MEASREDQNRIKGAIKGGSREDQEGIKGGSREDPGRIQGRKEDKVRLGRMMEGYRDEERRYSRVGGMVGLGVQ